MATRASRIALAGSNISSTGEVDADLLDNTDSAAFLSLDGSGRLGIGTSSADAFLTVDSNIGGSSTGTLARFHSSKGESDSTYLQIAATRHGTPSVQRVQLQAFDDDGSTGRTLALNPSGGNVGIGTNTPSAHAKLHVADGPYAFLALQATDSGGRQYEIFSYAADESFHLYDRTASSYRLTVDETGKVGIGTTTPAAPLDFGVTSTNQQVLLLRQNGNSRTGFGISNDYGVRVLAPHDVTSSGSLFGVGKNNGTTYSGDLLTVLYGGNVGIGTTSPDNPLEVVGADSGIKISSAAANRPQLRLECGTTENLVLSTNTTYGAIGDSTDLQRYMTLQDGDVKVGTGVLAKQHPQYGYTSWLHVTGGGNYINVKTNIYRSNKMYMLKLLGFVSYAGERIDTIITGYAYNAYLGNTGSSYSAITNHGVVGVALYYSSDNYLCFRTTTAGSYNSIDIQASTGAPGYYLGHPVEILAYTSISGTGNHY